LLAVLLLTLHALAGPADEKGQPAPALDPLVSGREYTAMFYAGQVDALWERLSDTMKAAFGSETKLQSFQTKLKQQMGAESRVLSENVTESSGLHVYVRHVHFGTSLERIEISWLFDDTGVIDSFYIRPAPEKSSVPPTYAAKTELRLPFDGVWHVLWGGRSLAENYHVVDRSQRYAYDFRVLEKGESHGGEGKVIADYYCWGKPIVAPGAGIVVAAVDGIPDNPPGEGDPRDELGNHVVIDHGNGEFSFLAHLARGSVKVKKSQAVRAGSVLGSCGNSGNSSEPHLHYHLQSSPELDHGDGLPAQFQHYRANGTEVARGEPTKSQTIENRKAEAKAR